MSSTNDIESKIKALFEGVILNNSRKDYLLTGIDKSIGSYYEEPKHPGQAYFSFINTDSVERLAEYFKDFWIGLGTPEFAVMAHELSELAFLLSADHNTQPDDVSPFVYTMY